MDTIYEKIDKDTCFLAVIHTSNVTGEIFDVKTMHITKSSRSF
jgi:selenocysteine lyase/cysteine desulfurase